MESADSLLEEKKLLNEPKYRNYMSNIDKALKNFEYSSEWADLISALGKLSKVISGNAQYQVIPRRIKISKRLAQCMHPALPSGVHLKALETYDVIFSKMGPERLATEMFIYSAGLFPLLGYAAMNVRPALLDIYEKYFVPLGEKLRPALSGFLSGVLPGYENGLDHYERTNSLMTEVCTAVNPIYFYACLWECVATNASIRLPAISYLLDHFNKRLGMQEQIYIMGHNHDVMMSGLCACLNDSLILVQRNTLEFLLLGFPMHTVYLKEEELTKLVTNSLNTILRRDMSLNRRLYSWMLGTEVNKGAQVEIKEGQESYFDKYSKKILIKSFIRTLKFSLETVPVDLKPYRILVSLLDKAEIGSEILDYVLCDVIRAMSLSSGNLEVSKSANLLFATFDPAYIWNFMTIIYEKSCTSANENSSELTKNLRCYTQPAEQKVTSVVGSGDPNLIEICYLTEFLLETISLEIYNETTRIYLPKVFLAITQLLTIHSEHLMHQEVTASLKLCMKIVSRVQPMITSPIKVVPNSKKSTASENKQKNVNPTVSEVGSLLEKSKSDSKLNQFACHEEEPIKRSNSNHFIDKKSPKKNKKAKSYSKLLELDKELSPDTGQNVPDLSPVSKKKSKNMNVSLNAKVKSDSTGQTESKNHLSLKEDPQNKNSRENSETEISLNHASLSTVNDNNESTSYCLRNIVSAQEHGILEKCIKQYEVFYEVYLYRQVLQSHELSRINSCPVTVTVMKDTSPIKVKNIFAKEEVYEDGNTERLQEIDKLFDTLKINSITRTTLLHNLLHKSMFGDDSTSDLSDGEFKDCCSSTEALHCSEMKKRFDEITENKISRLMSLTLSEPLRTSIKLASNLLVEMSTFPNCDKNITLDNHGKDLFINFASIRLSDNLTEVKLPSWLKVLALTGCYIGSDKELQLTAISTLFDLISLLKSQMEHSTSPGVTFVVMLPLLKLGHIRYIEDNTRIFQLVVSALWNYLGDSANDQKQISSLLYQLHSCLESGLVEIVIGNRMSNEYLQFSERESLKNFLQLGSNIELLSKYKLDRISDIQTMCVLPSQLDYKQELHESESQSFKKFELLWHLGREKQPEKGFDKTLLKVLDTLTLPYYVPMRTLVTKWLQVSLLRGDLIRLVKPLYKIILSSKTKRIGIVHAHLIKKDADDSLSDTTLSRDLDDEADALLNRDVYAISSEFGNIKYHTDSSQMKKRSPIRSLQKKFFGVTLGNKNRTSNFVSNKVSSSITEIDSNIGLIINPLDNSSDFEAADFEQGSLGTSLSIKDETTINDSTTEKEFKKDEILNNVEYSSSSEESDESCTETESEQRDVSVEKESVSSSGNLKRFAGDCERVSEALSEHDRTKNRKRYHLTRSSSEVMEKIEMSFTEVTDGIPPSTVLEESHTAEEYFSSSSGTTGTDIVENFMNDLMDQAAVNCVKPSAKTKSTKKKSNKKSSKSASGSEKKRMSCISKTSTDSNASGYVLSKSINEELVSDSNSHSDNENEMFDEKSFKTDPSSDQNDMDSIKRALSLGSGKINWDLAKETLEKGKQNVEILRQNVAIEGSNKNSNRKMSEEKKRHCDRVHPFHTHILLYFNVYDTKQTLYAFQTLRNMIQTDPRTFLCLCITTSIPSGSIKNLLVRHRKSIFGKGFLGNVANTEFSQAYRGCMNLELLVTVCLYYARSYFQKDQFEGKDCPEMEDIIGNCKVQLESIELLSLICNELIEIVRGMGKGLACYIADLMAKCKLQKIILHCLNSSVMEFLQSKNEILTEQILTLNHPQDENLHAESFQIQLLRLVMAVIKLEYEVCLLKNDESVNKTDGNGTTGSNSPSKLSGTLNVKYLPNSLISQQPMFLAAVLNALQADCLRHMHRNWTDLVTSSLNCFNFGSLTNIVISVVHQLCTNIDGIVGMSLKQQCSFPPDYVVSQLEAITVLCHYCLLDNTQQTTLSHLFNQAYPQTSVTAHSSNTGQLLNNIVHSFLSSQNSQENQSKNSQLTSARNAVLSHLFRIVASVAAIWDSELGQVRQVKQQLMEFLSPISLHHGTNFLAAIAVTWQERGEIFKKQQEIKNENRTVPISEQYLRNSLPQASAEQLSLVKLVSSIRVMPMDSFVQTLHQVVKSPPPIHKPPVGLTIEVSALELFYFYMKNAPAPQLGDSWSSLLLLLREGLALAPPAQFVLLMLLNEFVQRCPQMPFQDKKDIRDLHDVTSRLVEALSNVAGSCLEQTTWLRRNLAVKEDISPATPDGGVKDLPGNQQYSVQAQSVLASVLANLLDVAYGAQEKDKVVTIITTLMYNITPYLKNHTVRNIPSFYACSSLLASLSGYQYTRKAWRKDMLDLLLDSSFFQMDICCLPFWKQIMDSLMTYDNTTFRELMSRVSLTQTGGLNIFTSREQEYEQRALLLKRLAFVIYCSEHDQYDKYMPEIQEQLTNSLRLPNVVPSVQAAVLLCFRVLLLRMSPDHVTSVWPIIIAEMVQVFLAIEQELKLDSDDSNQQIRNTDSSWVNNSGNGLSSQNNSVHWRNVQLEAAKLLELGCVLPATNLPHFQMYRWAFVGTEYDGVDDKILTNGHLEELNIFSAGGYIPHVRRIARLMDMKYTVHSPKTEFKRGKYLVLTCQQINSLQDLYGFFSTLSVTWPTPHNFADTEKDVDGCLAEVENVLSSDFLEKMQTTTTPR